MVPNRKEKLRLRGTVLVSLRRVRFHPGDFINEWTRQQFLLPFCALKIFLLPALGDDVRLFLLEPEKKTVPARRPLPVFFFEFRVGFQRAQFSAKFLQRPAFDRKEKANGLSERELDRARSGKAPVH